MYKILAAMYQKLGKIWLSIFVTLLPISYTFLLCNGGRLRKIGFGCSAAAVFPTTVGIRMLVIQRSYEWMKQKAGQGNLHDKPCLTFPFWHRSDYGGSPLRATFD